MSKAVTVDRLPKCDFCDNPAHYDFKTRMGPWANACPLHWKVYRNSPQLGTGFGQRLIPPT
jgi:hypothetical protein